MSRRMDGPDIIPVVLFAACIIVAGTGMWVVFIQWASR